jgi:hypothetical protein
MIELNLINPCDFNGLKSEIKADLQAVDDKIIVDFFVKNNHEVHLYNVYQTGRSQNKKNYVYGIWDYDVIEVFLQPRKACPYYEFIVSPFNNYFELEIFKPRIDTNLNYKSNFDFYIFCDSQDFKTWSAKIIIDSKSIHFDKNKDELYGNFFSILGAPKNRFYYSAFLPTQKNPDFHLPQYFKKLI